MSWLTGKQIEIEVKNKKIMISPFNSEQVNPNSYDYRLAPIFKKLIPNSRSGGIFCVDPKKEMKYEKIMIGNEGYLMKPGRAYLGYTVERFGSDCFASLCTGKSSIGRIFVKNHHCAGLIDQGFRGHITLEMTAQLPTIIYPQMRIGQVFWFQSYGEALLYQGKYQKNNAGQLSKIYQDISQ
nr:hypothetical protein [Bacteroidota bacterium]